MLLEKFYELKTAAIAQVLELISDHIEHGWYEADTARDFDEMLKLLQDNKVKDVLDWIKKDYDRFS